MVFSRRRAVGALIASLAIALAGCRSNSAQSSPSQSRISAETTSGNAPEPVYVGTFTGKGSKGIYLTWLDPQSGHLSEPELVAEAQSPSYLALRPDGKFLYCVNEISNWEGKKTGAVSAYAISEDRKKLTLLNQQPSGGDGPTYISLDHTGHVALVANYGSGSAASLPIDADGRLREPATVEQHHGKGTDPSRQEGPHAHCFDADPGNHFALCADLGLDEVFVYRLNVNDGTLKPSDPATFALRPQSGPRHLAFHPDGRFVYVIDEMASNITAFSYDGSRGTMTALQTISTLPPDYHGQNTTAEIMVHPSGHFLYGSNRGHNSIAMFRIDANTGLLTAAGHVSTQGKNPRGFGVEPQGRFLIAGNQDSDNVVVYRIGPRTGELTPAGADLKVPTPVCITFAPRP